MASRIASPDLWMFQLDRLLRRTVRRSHDALTDDTGEEFLCHSRSFLELLHSVRTNDARTYYIPGHNSHLRWGAEDVSGARGCTRDRARAMKWIAYGSLTEWRVRLQVVRGGPSAVTGPFRLVRTLASRGFDGTGVELLGKKVD